MKQSFNLTTKTNPNSKKSTVPQNSSKETKKSRRIIQRRKNRYIKREIKKLNNETINRIQQKNKFLESQFGFYANPENSKCSNFNNALSKITSMAYNQPTNLAFHNLCKANSLPPGTTHLLGLNLKFCLASNHLNYNPKKSLLNLAYTIQTKEHLKNLQTEDNLEYIPQLYIKNKNWNPPPASSTIEDQLVTFDKAIKDKHTRLLTKYQDLSLTNLTTSQTKMLKLLRKQNEVVIKPSDKNLGPVAMDKDEYICQILKEHLLSKEYCKLTKQEATQKIETLHNTLKNYISSTDIPLSKAEQTCFHRSLKTFHRVPILYGLPKVHKNPVSLRPVVSSTNSLLSVFFTWLDYKTKELLPLINSYTRNSTDVINELKSLTLPKGAKIFSADAKSTYTNIDTDLG